MLEFGSLGEIRTLGFVHCFIIAHNRIVKFKRKSKPARPQTQKGSEPCQLTVIGFCEVQTVRAREKNRVHLANKLH